MNYCGYMAVTNMALLTSSLLSKTADILYKSKWVAFWMPSLQIKPQRDLRNFKQNLWSLFKRGCISLSSAGGASSCVCLGDSRDKRQITPGFTQLQVVPESCREANDQLQKAEWYKASACFQSQRVRVWIPAPPPSNGKWALASLCLTQLWILNKSLCKMV